MEHGRFSNSTRNGGIETAPLLGVEKDVALEPETIVIDIPDDLDKEPISILRGFINRFLPGVEEQRYRAAPAVSARINPFEEVAINGDVIGPDVSKELQSSVKLVSVEGQPIVEQTASVERIRDWGLPHTNRERAVSESSPGEICRICLLSGSTDRPLFSPCACPETARFVHETCFDQWRISGSSDMMLRCPQCLAAYHICDVTHWWARTGRILRKMLQHRALLHMLIWIILALITIGVRYLDSTNALIRGLHLQCDYLGFFSALHRVCSREVTDDAFIALYYFVILTSFLAILCLSWCVSIYSLPNRRLYFRQCWAWDSVLFGLLWIMTILFTLFTNIFLGTIVLTVTVDALLRVQLNHITSLLIKRLYTVLPYQKPR